MENFDPRPNAVKEKNLYIVHLDTPRIIILSSVIIGIITAAFLLGMTFVKEDKQASKNFANSSMSFDENRAADILRTDIPPMPIDGDDFNSIEDKIATSENKSNPLINAPVNEENKALHSNNTASAKDEIKHDKGDILTNANIKEIIPPVGEKDKPVKQEKKIAKDTGDRNKKIAAKDNAKDHKRDDVKSANANEKGKVYGVSRNADIKKNNGSFSVQVASYDTVSRAEQEKSFLKSKSFDAYIDKGLVNGKNYFRLRVGPVSSQKEAYSLLNELQSDSRYRESYIVME